MYCRVTSVTGTNIVLPGTFETYRLPLGVGRETPRKIEAAILDLHLASLGVRDEVVGRHRAHVRVRAGGSSGVFSR